MPAESIVPYFTFRQGFPDGNPPLAFFYDLPTAARVSVPEVKIPAQDAFAPLFRVIMPNIVDSITLFAADSVPGQGIAIIETQIRVSPVYGGVSNDYPVVAKGEAVLAADPFVQQVSGVSFQQVSVWGRIVPPAGDRRVQFCAIIRKTGCCQKTQF